MLTFLYDLECMQMKYFAISPVLINFIMVMIFRSNHKLTDHTTGSQSTFENYSVDSNKIKLQFRFTSSYNNFSEERDGQQLSDHTMKIYLTLSFNIYLHIRTHTHMHTSVRFTLQTKV